jgi:membrane protein DedA with SNARE-associated domain
VNELFQAALQWAAQGGLPALAALALATLISEDLACIAAGLLIAQGAFDPLPATIACFVGIFTGDLLLVLVGRMLGARALKTAPLRWWISPASLRRAEIWFARRGPSLVFASRFMPGMRLPTYIAVGVLRAPLARFVTWFALACAVWVPLLVGAAALFGRVTYELFERWANASVLAITAALLVWCAARVGIALSTWRGRRLLLGRWRRLTRWEFWPMWAVYPPVIAYILWLGLRHRFALPSAANPGIGHGGGLVGESKSEILRGLAGAGDAIATWALIQRGSFDARSAAIREFMTRNGQSFPVVLKPDVGERGTGVVIVRNAKELEDALVHSPAPLIAQHYVPGVEYGVFYYRLPDAAHGEILAITDKRMVHVTGDGRRTLEELILADDRAVCMAPFFLGRFATRLDEVPAAGESVALSELGTHCRGALFLDGTHLLTPALHRAVEDASRAFDGFHFGRYDVRAASQEAFQRGEFKVIELNGLTSEATSIYDPRHSVWFGWRMLCRQWQIAFEIAAANRSRGAERLTLSAAWRILTRRPVPNS